ncbi:MAG: SpoIIE family protein phosphatase, partial [Bacteroidaceae bacterium]|nr:SpoIIE family protein phosphatase [Bacteroidaceae bacterium]
WNYNAQTIDIKTQTVIFLYTDGLTEAKNAENDMFGNKRLLTVAEELTEEGISIPEQMIHHMSEAVESFVNGYEQSDDLTMLAIKYI